jgi:predicted nucleic acid-binding protein
LQGVSLVTSSFAVQEARRNLRDPEQEARLDGFLRGIEIGEALMLPPEHRGQIELPEKDWPILGGAVASGATHLITGDQRHFGQYFGRRVLGVWILRPADYIREEP